MNIPGMVSAGLLFAAFVTGSLSDVPPAKAPVMLGGYRVLAADFHVHNFPLSSGTLAPWDLVLEARRQSLDAIAITPHNNAVAGKAGRWFANLVGGPTVLAGEEIHGPAYHLIAVGIHRTISWRLSAGAAIAEVHRQGGVAIAAHPVASSWAAFDAQAMAALDGAEVAQPIVYSGEAATTQLRQFYARGHLAAIGSSDYHGPGPLGICRTYVFARANTETAILDAIRLHHTVVFDRGHIFGDPEMIRIASEGNLAEPAVVPYGFLAVLSRVCGVLGLVGAILLGFRERKN